MYTNLIEILRSNYGCATGYYQAIHELSGKARLFWDDVLHAWVVTGYEECMRLLINSDLERSRLSLPSSVAAQNLLDAALSILNVQTMFSDGSEAELRRRFWSRCLQPDSTIVGDYNAEAIANSCFDEYVANVGIEAHGDLLQPYVSRVVCSRLGMEETDRRILYPKIVQYARFLDGKMKNAAEIGEALHAVILLYTDITMPSLAKEHDGYTGRHELLSDYILAIAAGHDSTAYLLGNVLLYVNSDRTRLDNAARSSHSLLALVKEAARFDSPVQMIGRCAQCDIILNGEEIKKGEKVFLHIGAANRDAGIFDQPHVFDPNRSGPAHLAFGTGRSRCPGVGLSIDETITFLATLVARGFHVSIDETGIEWDHGLAGRGFRSLPAQLVHV